MAVLYKSDDVYEKISAIDQDIRSYIRSTEGDSYTTAIREDCRFEVFFHLSDLRTGLISWYDFSPAASILEIGAGFGALTGILCQKCAQVTAIEYSLFRAETICERYPGMENLKVYAASMHDIPVKESFDYILLAGGLETIADGSFDPIHYADYIKYLKRFLNPGGILLIAVENRYGLRYFCGAKEPYTHIPFSGIRKNMGNARGRSFSKRELEDILYRAKVEHWKFYYPLPDYKLPQLIYTDAHLPDNNVTERLLSYYVDPQVLLASENELYDDIVANAVFPFFANSYFVEIGENSRFCSVEYAALSTDRGRERAFVTSIHEDGKVYKRPVYNEGIGYAKKVAEQTWALEKQGIPLVTHSWDGRGIVMPKIEAPTLSNYIKKVIRTNPDELVQIIDQLWQLIRQSSPQVSAEKNALASTGSEDLSWGPILAKAYLELIPLNAFFKNGQFLFFDQEYIRENYPAKYILFRALYYINVCTPRFEEYISLEDLKKKYGLVELWEIFLQEENGRFQREVRKHEDYQQFYQWLQVDERQMNRNAQFLGFVENFSLGHDELGFMQKLWEVQVDLLKRFKAVCEKYQLQYFLINRTLLGAVRYHGFLPWDYDVDVALPRKDYEQLLGIAQSEFIEPYFFQTPENNPDCFYGGSSRLRNTLTTGMSKRDEGKQCHLGMWMDIFPIDACSRDRFAVQKQVKRVRFWQRALFIKVYNDLPGGESLFKKVLYRSVAAIMPQRWMYAALRRSMRVYENQNTKDVAIFTYLGNPAIFAKKDFAAAVYLIFGELRIPVPQNYMDCLKVSLGQDYMAYPSVFQRRPYHKGIFKPTMPFKEYNALFAGLFDKVEDKKIVIFGAGAMYQAYMQKYGASHPPFFIIDNDEKKWGTKVLDIDVRPPQDLLTLPEGRRYVIICSIYYKEIGEQLRATGIWNYKVYVEEKERAYEETEIGW